MNGATSDNSNFAAAIISGIDVVCALSIPQFQHDELSSWYRPWDIQRESRGLRARWIYPRSRNRRVPNSNPFGWLCGAGAGRLVARDRSRGASSDGKSRETRHFRDRVLRTNARFRSDWQRSKGTRSEPSFGRINGLPICCRRSSRLLAQI